jgi:hypothetical protein
MAEHRVWFEGVRRIGVLVRREQRGVQVRGQGGPGYRVRRRGYSATFACWWLIDGCFGIKA